jgi:hypothetical protein
MYNRHHPQVNAWYTNLSGKLFKVKMLLINKQGISRIAIEFLDGSQQLINLQEWECLRMAKQNTLKSKLNSGSEELSH